MGFWGHEKWTSGEFWINTNTISKQGNKIYIYMTSTSSTLGSGFYPHKDTWDILS